MTDIIACINGLAERLLGEKRRLATVESCTGGGIASQLTAVAGSSQWFECGFVTYSNAAKTRLVGVAPALIEEFGAVSIEVAEAMALGGIRYGNAHYAVSVTGIAGPDGGTEDKPVGTVCIGWAGPGSGKDCEVSSHRFQFSGDREQVRRLSIESALRGLLQRLDGQSGDKA